MSCARGDGRRRRAAGARNPRAALALLPLVLLWSPLASGFVGVSVGWIPILGGRRASSHGGSGEAAGVLKEAATLIQHCRASGLRSTCIPGLLRLRATVVGDDSTDAKLQELLDKFKASKGGGSAEAPTGASNKSMQSAILMALGEADELLDARGAKDATRKETKLHVSKDVVGGGEPTRSIHGKPGALPGSPAARVEDADIKRLLGETDSLLVESAKKWEVMERERIARLEAPPPVKSLDEEEQDKRLELAGRMRKCKTKADIAAVLAAVRQEGLVVDAIIGTAAIEVLSRRALQLRTRTASGAKAAADAVEMAKTILRNLREHHSGKGLHHNKGVSYTPTSVTYSAYIALLSRASAAGATNVDLDDGLAALADMRSDNLEADAYDLASLLSLCANTLFPPQMGRLARGRALLNEFASAGVPADKVVYNGLLFVCARDKASTLADGYAVVKDMEAAGLQPDAYTYATLLDLVSRNGASKEDAEDVLQAMVARQVGPTTTVLNSYLKVLAQSAEGGKVGAEEAKGMLARMRELNVPVDVITMSTVMEILVAAVRYGKATRRDAWDVISEARQSNIEPTDSMYSSWIQVISHEALNGDATARDGLDALNAVRQWSSRSGQRVSPRLYNLALDCVAKTAIHQNGGIADGEEILQALTNDGVGLSAVSLTSFIQIAKADHKKESVDRAWQVYESAPTAIKTQRVVTMMISSLARVGQRKRARLTLEGAIDAGVTPNRYMFNAAMGACSKPEQVFELRSRMQIAGIEGDQVTRKYVRLAERGKLPSPGIIAANKVRLRKMRRPPKARPSSGRGDPQSPR